MAFPAANLFTHHLYRCLRSVYSTSWSVRVRISSAAVSELRFWRSSRGTLAPTWTTRGRTQTCSPDASAFGWELHWDRFSPTATSVFSNGTSSTKGSYAPYWRLKSFDIADRHIQVGLDSATATFSLIKWKSSSPSCVVLLQEIYHLVASLDPSLVSMDSARMQHRRGRVVEDSRPVGLPPGDGSLSGGLSSFGTRDRCVRLHTMPSYPGSGLVPQPGADRSVGRSGAELGGPVSVGKSAMGLDLGGASKGQPDQKSKNDSGGSRWRSAHWWPTLRRLQADHLTCSGHLSAWMEGQPSGRLSALERALCSLLCGDRRH